MDRGSDPTAGIGRRALSTHREHRSLTTGFDQLVGRGRWVERSGLARFRSGFRISLNPTTRAGTVTAVFGEWPYRLNLRSRGRALLMLFLFSEVGEADAPTRILVGSHLGGNVVRRTGRSAGKRHQTPSRSRNWHAGRCLSLSPIPRACCPDASRHRAPLHRAATSGARRRPSD